jgi:hypothetical protein
MSNSTFAYVLIFRDSPAATDRHLSPEEKQQLLNEWSDWYEGLLIKGKLREGNPLEVGGRVVSGAGGENIVGRPFFGGSESIGGYFVLEVSGFDEATEIAKQCPSLRHGMVVEVRAIGESCHVAHALGDQSNRSNIVEFKS